MSSHCWFCKKHIWCRGEGSREAGMCGNPCRGWNLSGRGFLGTGDALSPCVGFSTALVTGTALLVRNTRGKRKSSSSSHGFSRQQLKKTVSSELSLQKSLKECYKKKIYLLPCSSIVNKLSFFFFYLVVNLTCPPRR